MHWTSYKGQVAEAPRSGFWKEPGGNAKILDATIFVRVLLTAVIAIEDLCRLFRRRKFIDNTAAAGVMRRVASTTAHGNELAQRVVFALATSECQLSLRV